MPVIFCNFDMFNMNAQVLVVKEGAQTQPLFTGDFESVCNYMAAEYSTNNYAKIILAGPYAKVLEDRVRTYSMMNYNNNEINIEIID